MTTRRTSIARTRTEVRPNQNRYIKQTEARANVPCTTSALNDVRNMARGVVWLRRLEWFAADTVGKTTPVIFIYKHKTRCFKSKNWTTTKNISTWKISRCTHIREAGHVSRQISDAGGQWSSLSPVEVKQAQTQPGAQQSSQRIIQHWQHSRQEPKHSLQFRAASTGAEAALETEIACARLQESKNERHYIWAR